MRIKKGDKVKVITGAYKGTIGEVKAVFPKEDRVIGACWCFNWSVIWQLMLLEVLAKN